MLQTKASNASSVVDAASRPPPDQLLNSRRPLARSRSIHDASTNCRPIELTLLGDGLIVDQFVLIGPAGDRTRDVDERSIL
jgi:hypothetical protein